MCSLHSFTNDVSWDLSVDPCILGGLPDLLVLVFLATSVHSPASERAAEQKLLVPSSTVYGATITVVLLVTSTAVRLFVALDTYGTSTS